MRSAAVKLATALCLVASAAFARPLPSDVIGFDWAIDGRTYAGAKAPYSELYWADADAVSSTTYRTGGHSLKLKKGTSSPSWALASYLSCSRNDARWIGERAHLQCGGLDESSSAVLRVDGAAQVVFAFRQDSLPSTEQPVFIVGARRDYSNSGSDASFDYNRIELTIDASGTVRAHAHYNASDDTDAEFGTVATLGGYTARTNAWDCYSVQIVDTASSTTETTFKLEVFNCDAGDDNAVDSGILSGTWDWSTAVTGSNLAARPENVYHWYQPSEPTWNLYLDDVCMSHTNQGGSDFLWPCSVYWSAANATSPAETMESEYPYDPATETSWPCAWQGGSCTNQQRLYGISHIPPQRSTKSYLDSPATGGPFVTAFRPNHLGPETAGQSISWVAGACNQVNKNAQCVRSLRALQVHGWFAGNSSDLATQFGPTFDQSAPFDTLCGPGALSLPDGTWNATQMFRYTIYEDMPSRDVILQGCGADSNHQWNTANFIDDLNVVLRRETANAVGTTYLQELGISWAFDSYGPPPLTATPTKSGTPTNTPLITKTPTKTPTTTYTPTRTRTPTPDRTYTPTPSPPPAGYPLAVQNVVRESLCETTKQSICSDPYPDLRVAIQEACDTIAAGAPTARVVVNRSYSGDSSLSPAPYPPLVSGLDLCSNLELICEDGQEIAFNFPSPAITAAGRSNVTIRNCVLHTDYAPGIFLDLYGASRLTFEGNTIELPVSTTADALRVGSDTSSNILVTGNTISNAVRGIVIDGTGDNVTVRLNRVTNPSVAGIYADSSAGAVIDRNRIAGSQPTSNNAKGIWLDNLTNSNVVTNNGISLVKWGLFRGTDPNASPNYYANNLVTNIIAGGEAVSGSGPLNDVVLDTAGTFNKVRVADSSGVATSLEPNVVTFSDGAQMRYDPATASLAATGGELKNIGGDRGQQVGLYWNQSLSADAAINRDMLEARAGLGPTDIFAYPSWVSLNGVQHKFAAPGDVLNFVNSSNMLWTWSGDSISVTGEVTLQTAAQLFVDKAGCGLPPEIRASSHCTIDKPCCTIKEALTELQSWNNGAGMQHFNTCLEATDSLTGTLLGCGRCTGDISVSCNEDADCGPVCFTGAGFCANDYVTPCTSDADCVSVSLNVGTCAVDNSVCDARIPGDTCAGPALPITVNIGYGRYVEVIRPEQLRPGGVQFVGTGAGASFINNCTSGSQFWCVSQPDMQYIGLSGVHQDGPFNRRQCVVDISGLDGVGFGNIQIGGLDMHGLCTFGDTHRSGMVDSTTSKGGVGWPLLVVGHNNTTFTLKNTGSFGSYGSAHAWLFENRGAACSLDDTRGCFDQTSCNGCSGDDRKDCSTDADCSALGLGTCIVQKFGTCSQAGSGDIGTYGAPFFVQPQQLGGAAIEFDDTSCGTSFNLFVDHGIVQLAHSWVDRPNVGLLLRRTLVCVSDKTTKCVPREQEYSLSDTESDWVCPTDQGACQSSCTGPYDYRNPYRNGLYSRPALRIGNLIFRGNDALPFSTMDVEIAVLGAWRLSMRGHTIFDPCRRIIGDNADVITADGGGELQGYNHLGPLPPPGRTLNGESYGCNQPTYVDENERYYRPDSIEILRSDNKNFQTLIVPEGGQDGNANEITQTWTINHPNARALDIKGSGFTGRFGIDHLMGIYANDKYTIGVNTVPTASGVYAVRQGRGGAYVTLTAGQVSLGYVASEATYTPTPTVPTSTPTATPTATKTRATRTPTATLAPGTPAYTATPWPYFTQTPTRTATTTPTAPVGQIGVVALNCNSTIQGCTFNSKIVDGVPTPSSASHAANKQYVDDQIATVSNPRTVVTGTVTTTDATQTTLVSYTTTADTYLIEAYANARCTSCTFRAAGGFQLAATVRNSFGSSASFIGSVTTIHSATENGYSATLTVSGAAVRLSITGAAGQTVNWEGIMYVHH